MLVMTGTPFAFANNAFTYDFNSSMRPDMTFQVSIFAALSFNPLPKPLLHWLPQVPNSIKT